MVGKIKGKTKTDQEDQVLPDNIALLVELVHAPIESHPIRAVKEKSAIESMCYEEQEGNEAG